MLELSLTVNFRIARQQDFVAARDRPMRWVRSNADDRKVAGFRWPYQP